MVVMVIEEELIRAERKVLDFCVCVLARRLWIGLSFVRSRS
jgi:hypothetical protein